MEEVKGTRNIFVLIDTKTDIDEDTVIKNLFKFEEIKEVHVITGEYDFLAVAKIDLHGKSIFTDVQEESRKLLRRIRTLDVIRDTKTIVPFTTFARESQQKAKLSNT